MKAIILKMILFVLVIALVFIELALASAIDIRVVKSEECIVAREEYICRTVLLNGVPYLWVMRETPQGMFVKSIYLITGEETISIYQAWEI